MRRSKKTTKSLFVYQILCVQKEKEFFYRGLLKKREISQILFKKSFFNVSLKRGFLALLSALFQKIPSSLQSSADISTQHQ